MYFYKLGQSKKNYQLRENITNTTVILPEYTIMYPSGQCLIGASFKDQTVVTKRTKLSISTWSPHSSTN